MNIVIVGAGEVGYHLADILSREKHRVSVIDPDPSKSRRLMESLDVQVVVGDGTRADVMTQLAGRLPMAVICELLSVPARDRDYLLDRADTLVLREDRVNAVPASSQQGFRGPAPEPRFDQGWFARLDAAAAYAMVCRARPRRIVEVGSGHSTRFLARAVRDQGLETVITCIDPAPRAALDGLPVRWRRCVVQKAALDDFRALDAGDILFVDSSHVLMPGSDVDRLIGTVLPALAPGVLVHFHDVFLPDPYPRSWAWRGYNEQGAIAALLQGGAYALCFASHYLATRHLALVEQGVLSELPNLAPGLESSLWLEKRA